MTSRHHLSPAEHTHTPGPWRVAPNGFDGFQIVYNEAGNWLAEVFDDCDPVEGRPEADARLIAAAPDMSEALRPFALVAEHDIGSDEDDADLFQVMSVHNHAPKLTVGDLRRALAAYVKAVQS